MPELRCPECGGNVHHTPDRTACHNCPWEDMQCSITGSLLMKKKKEERTMTLDFGGKIENKTQKSGETNNTPWTRTVYAIGGNAYSTFDEELSHFQAGEEICGTFEQKGNYRNIKTASLMDGPLHPPEEVVRESVDENRMPTRTMVREHLIVTREDVLWMMKSLESDPMIKEIWLPFTRDPTAEVQFKRD